MDDSDELLMLYDGPTTVLEGRDIPSIAKYMKSPQCKRVFVMVGNDLYDLPRMQVLTIFELSNSWAQVRATNTLIPTRIHDGDHSQA